ncbi:MAG TPA: saccharopine dehydrogenase C-terminal domain-containing protein [Pyrinomonadaceae bacterium]
MKILVLGSGRMGLGVAFDLAQSPDVEVLTVADIDMERARAVAETLKSDKVKPASIDVANHRQVTELMRGHDAAVSCVVYHHNLRLACAAIEARVNFCDLGGNNSVVAEELALDEAARAAGINIIPDCGLAPGLVSILAAHGARLFEQLEAIHIRVGGLPQNPRPPLNYQIVFSVEGLINEYVERARVLRDGQIVEVDSMTEIERLSFAPPFTEMEAFQTSGGSSTLPESFKERARELDYKTIRYPGHCEQFKLLIDLGLASNEEIEVEDRRVRPRRLLAEMLLRHLPADEPDVVLIRVEFRGVSQGTKKRLRYDIIDRFDESTGLSAMMRTTSFPASIIAQMMARGEITKKGAIPQEHSVPPDIFVGELAKRNIQITTTIE